LRTIPCTVRGYNWLQADDFKEMLMSNDETGKTCSGESGSGVCGLAPPRRKLIVGGGIIAASVAALLIAMNSVSLDFYSSVTEFLKRAEVGKTGVVRVRGLVVTGSVNHNAETLDTKFALADGTASVLVVYHGVLPSSFEPGSDLVVQGSYDADNKRLLANQLMFKCPSKYEKRRGQY